MQSLQYFCNSKHFWRFFSENANLARFIQNTARYFFVCKSLGKTPLTARILKEFAFFCKISQESCKKCIFSQLWLIRVNLQVLPIVEEKYLFCKILSKNLDTFCNILQDYAFLADILGKTSQERYALRYFRGKY